MARQVMKLFHPTLYKRLRYCLAVFLLTGPLLSYGQKVVRNPAGEKIIQYDDGTWRYFEGRDSLLESGLWDDINPAEIPPIEPLPADQRPRYDYRLFQKYIAAAVRYESEMVDKVDESSNEAHSLEDQIRQLESSGESGEAQRLTQELELLNERRQDEQRLLSYARSLIKRILKIGKKEKYEKLEGVYVPGLNTKRELNREDSLNIARTTDTQEPKIMIAESQKNPVTPVSPPSEPISRDQPAPDSIATWTISTSVEKPDSSMRADSLTGEEPLIAAQAPEDQTETEISEQLPELIDQPINPETSGKTEKNAVNSSLIAGNTSSWFSDDQEITPGYHCEFTFHGIDEFTNSLKKELKEELFFSHTDERLKPFLKNIDYVSCKGYLTSISGGFRYLTLILTIASKNAAREYGYIKSGSMLNLKLLDGETVSLFTQSENQGTLDPKSGFTTYKARYPIDYQKEKILLKSGLDKVRIVWSSGYEDYEVFNIDFFINQINCLNAK